MKDLESFNHEHRQKIMKDFEMIKMREEEVDRQRKLNDERLSVEQMRLETL
jgi:oral-facial-digital syndrome 1 protein